MKMSTMTAIGTLFLANSAIAQPAIVYKDTITCTLPTLSGQTTTSDVQIVETFSSTGVVTLKCTAKYDDDKAPAAVYDYESSGLLCGVTTSSGYTTTQDWHAVANANGSKLICKF